MRLKRVILESWEFQNCQLELAAGLEMYKIMGFQGGWIFLCNRRAARDGESVVIGAKCD